MTYQGITTRAGMCAICKVALPTGTLVYFDSTKRHGSHLAHPQCWEPLRDARRAEGPQTGRKPKAVKQSAESLDPPF
jgi:hypothetical protein